MSDEKKETIKKEEPKKETVKKVEPKKAEEIKKDFEKVGATKTKKPSTGRGISMKNWIFIVIALIIAFGAGYYISFASGQNQIKSCQNTINEYENSINTLQQKQDIIQDLLSK